MAHSPISLVLRRIRGLIGVDIPEESSDGELLQRFITVQDESAFEELVSRYGSLVLGLCNRLLRDAHDAEDAFQATFMVLARKAAAIRKQESVGSWLYGVAYRVAHEARTKAARRRVHERQAGDMSEELAAEAQAPKPEAVEKSVIDDELQRLPEKYRAPLILCYLQGKTNEEAARQLRWPTGTVKGRLSRARDLLRDRLTRRGVALAPATLPLVLAENALAEVPPRLAEITLRSALSYATGTAAGASAGALSLAEGVVKAMFWNQMKRFVPAALLLVGLMGAGLWTYHTLAAEQAGGQAPPVLVRSAQSGPWSAAATWEGGKLPAAGNKVQIKQGHTVVYDVKSDQVIRSVHVNGILTFATDKDTQLNTALVRIQPGDDVSEDGFECDHVREMPAESARNQAALEVGTANKPVDAKHTALIRLAYIDGMNKESLPAIVCCSGRMDFHGTPLSRTWVKLGESTKVGDNSVVLAEAVTGWKVGDQIIVTATNHIPAYKKGGLSTEERIIQAIDGTKITFDKALENEHLGTGDYRGEVANLTRNVVVESADPAGVRGHTMYHRFSAGSISYAEFRHLGKEGVLGRYSLHFHLIGDTMRGSSVVGASIHNSGNRWITIHGTNYLVVRDCVGYKSMGHGYFLEDGTEVYNVLDRNLAVAAKRTKRLPKQVLSFDENNGAGFWWANSLNTFTRNVAAENDNYGFRYEATASSASKLAFPIQQPDGTKQTVDIRTLPFVRFDDNEVHSSVGLYGINLGEGVNRVGPDSRHPFIVRNTKIWDTHYGFRPQVPSLLVENMKIHKVAYGVYHPNYDNHVYKDLYIAQTNTEPFNRGHDDISIQYGQLTVDGLTFDNIRSGGMPLIQISDDNPTGTAVTHFRNLKVVNWADSSKQKAIVNLGGGPRPQPKTEKGVPVYVHDYFGDGKHAQVSSTRSAEFKAEPASFREEKPLTGDESRVREVKDIPFPKLLDPVDDLPPQTIITHVSKLENGKLTVRGTTADNGTVTKVTVNGKEAKATAANFAEWEIVLDGVKGGEVKLQARSEDTAGNVEKLPHSLAVVR